MLNRRDLAALALDIRAGKVPALSVRQPWADGLIWGGKPVENRPKRGRHRGWTLIHASAGMTSLEATQFERFCEERGIRRAYEGKGLAQRTRGAIIGALIIQDCVDSHPSRWWIGPHAFLIRHPIAFDPVPCKGTVFPLFWTPDRDVRLALARQLMRRANYRSPMAMANAARSRALDPDVIAIGGESHG